MCKPRSCFVWGKPSIYTSRPFTHNLEQSDSLLLRYFNQGKLQLNFGMHFRLGVELEMLPATTSPASACIYCLGTQSRVGADSVCTTRDCPKVQNRARTTLFILVWTAGLHARDGFLPAARVACLGV